MANSTEQVGAGEEIFWREHFRKELPRLTKDCYTGNSCVFIMENPHCLSGLLTNPGSCQADSSLFISVCSFEYAQPIVASGIDSNPSLSQHHKPARLGTRTATHRRRQP